MHRTQPPVVPVGVGVRREKDRPGERHELNGSSDREDCTHPSRAIAAEKGNGEDVESEGGNARAQVKPGPLRLAAGVLGSEG